MKTLYELNRQNLRQSKLIESLIPQEENSPLRRLYQLLNTGKEHDDKTMMLKIYGKKNITAFSRLKSRLREIYLQGIILQINENNSLDTRSNEALMASRYTLLGKSLVTRDLNWITAAILEKSISKAIKFNFTDDILLQSRLLINYYSGAENYNKYKSKKYLDVQKKYLYVYEWEVKAENYYLDLQNLQYNSLANVTEESKRKVENYCRELSKVKDINTYRFVYNRYRIFSAFYEYNKDYESMLNISESILKDLSHHDSISSVTISAINVRRLWALIQAGRLEDTVSNGYKAMTKTNEGSVAWYRLAHYVLKAILFQKKYSRGVDLISQLMKHPKYIKLIDYYQEIFNTTLGYLHLVVDSGLAGNAKELKKKLPEFKLGKFLNTTPVFSKDKRGINVSILLMHIAFLLQRKDYSAIIDRTDSLNQYAYRYLRRDDSFRSNCMIKMVIQMTKADFHPIRTERYTADLRRQLSTVHLAGSGENIEIEIIPFEVLWEIMIKSL